MPRVDWNRALAPQVLRMSGAGYRRWSRRQYRDRSLLVFPWPWLERLTYTAWQLVPLIWLPVAAALFGLAAYIAAYNAVEMSPLITAFVCGFVSWSLLEYSLHRFFFHLRPWNGVTALVHFLAHGIHHMTPSDPYRLVFPPFFAATVFLTPMTAAAYAAAGARGLALMSGLIVGFVRYDLTHYWLHHAKRHGKEGSFQRHLFNAHMAHHADERRLYDVSGGGFLDRLFGTYDAPSHNAPLRK